MVAPPQFCKSSMMRGARFSLAATLRSARIARACVRKVSAVRASAGVHAALLGANVALFERAEPAFPRRPTLHVPLVHPGLGDLLGWIAERYGYEVV